MLYRYLPLYSCTGTDCFHSRCIMLNMLYMFYAIRQMYRFNGPLSWKLCFGILSVSYCPFKKFKIAVATYAHAGYKFGPNPTFVFLGMVHMKYFKWWYSCTAVPHVWNDGTVQLYRSRFIQHTRGREHPPQTACIRMMHGQIGPVKCSIVTIAGKYHTRIFLCDGCWHWHVKLHSQACRCRGTSYYSLVLVGLLGLVGTRLI